MGPRADERQCRIEGERGRASFLLIVRPRAVRGEKPTYSVGFSPTTRATAAIDAKPTLPRSPSMPGLKTCSIGSADHGVGERAWPPAPAAYGPGYDL